MKKKTLFWILGIVIVTLVVLVGGKKAGMFGKTKRGKEVEIAKITPIDIIETVAATGKIQPEVEVALSSEVSGEIISLPIKEGQEIKKRRITCKDQSRFNTSSRKSKPGWTSKHKSTISSSRGFG